MSYTSFKSFKISLLFLCFPFACFAQVSVTGKILNKADSKPIANASVFLSNATIGATSGNNGAFTLSNINPGQYELIISVVGFETYSQHLTIGNVNIQLPGIDLVPRSIELKEVNIAYHKDPDREKYLGWFRDEFLGISETARDCKILNPEILDLDYDATNKKLTASSGDFLVIENDALGYKISYLLTDFSLETKSTTEKKVFYQGPVRFEEMKGTPSQEKRWVRNRQDIFENSPMHFLRSALNGSTIEEGFRIQKQISINNPGRPADSVINARIRYFKQAKKGGDANLDDSIAAWTKLARLPKKLAKTITLTTRDFIKATDQPGIYAFVGDSSNMFVAYDKSRHFYVKNTTEYLYNANNDENTFVRFNSPAAFFSGDGVILNPYSVTYYGVWGRNRVAELLPINYRPEQGDKNQSTLLNDLNAKLDTFTNNHPIEKAYLQFDKPYYASGDTIYFKAYVTKGAKHELSDLSGVLHVDLVGTDNKISRSIKLQLDSGVTWGDFALPDSLPEGNYRVKAYTRLMENEGNEGFFEKSIQVGSILDKKTPESGVPGKKSLAAKADVQFFPEGGYIINGIHSKIAFKAIGPDGSGIGIKGVILNNEHKEVATFASEHRGMGCFYLNPQPGESYTARISYANGIEDSFALPKAQDNGIVLSVNNDTLSKAVVRIAVSPAYYRQNKNKVYGLVIYSGGISRTILCPLDSNLITLDILKRRLRTGVAMVTLFSPAAEPLCERLFFVQNYDQLNINVVSNKTSYGKREKVAINLNVKNRADFAAIGHFSVSVTDESKVPVDENSENTILSNLLLTSDLKGYIEQPNYYFINPTVKTNSELDLVMLTHGYRHFEWKQILDKTSPSPAWQPEKGLEISGMVKGLSGKPVANGAVTLLPREGGLLSSMTNDQGVFHFTGLMFNDTTHFMLNAINATGKNLTKITWFPDTVEAKILRPGQIIAQKMADTTMSKYVRNARDEKDELMKYNPVGGRMLKEVKIREIKKDDKYETQSFAGAGNADQVMHANEIEKVQGQLVTSLDGRLYGISFMGSIKKPYLRTKLSVTSGKSGPMLVIIDGAEVPPESINYYTANDIETVEVLKYASAAVYGMQGGNGVLILTTKKGGGMNAKDITSVGVLPIAPMGFYKAREFYSPKYDSPQLTSKQRDLRSTIYWKPEIVTDKDGNSSFEYYNADDPGNYRIMIEGIDRDGNIGRKVFNYRVE
jgi:TonB-dependent SusC/RagA subfamily outer membrane receptor